MIVCAERMLSRLDPLGTLQRKRLFFLPCYCVLQTCYSDVLFELISVHKISYNFIAVNTIIVTVFPPIKASSE